MKRRFPSSMPDLSEPPHPRTRVLSEEELALWDSVARQTKPLRKKRLAKAQPTKAQPIKAQPTKVPHPKAPADKTPATPSRAVKPVARPAAAARPMAPPPPSKPSKSTVPPLASLGRRERARLSRGKNEIDARLDLHGMTQIRAHHALLGFLQRAHSDGMTFVLVITGKGKVGAEQERGVLRRQVPHWLGLPEFRALVVGFEEAHIGHGGEGALYVRVRRSRD